MVGARYNGHYGVLDVFMIQQFTPVNKLYNKRQNMNYEKHTQCRKCLSENKRSLKAGIML